MGLMYCQSEFRLFFRHYGIYRFVGLFLCNSITSVQFTSNTSNINVLNSFNANGLVIIWSPDFDGISATSLPPTGLHIGRAFRICSFVVLKSSPSKSKIHFLSVSLENFPHTELYALLILVYSSLTIWIIYVDIFPRNNSIRCFYQTTFRFYDLTKRIGLVSKSTTSIHRLSP